MQGLLSPTSLLYLSLASSLLLILSPPSTESPFPGSVEAGNKPYEYIKQKAKKIWPIGRWNNKSKSHPSGDPTNYPLPPSQEYHDLHGSTHIPGYTSQKLPSLGRSSSKIQITEERRPSDRIQPPGRRRFSSKTEAFDEGRFDSKTQVSPPRSPSRQHMITPSGQSTFHESPSEFKHSLSAFYYDEKVQELMCEFLNRYAISVRPGKFDPIKDLPKALQRINNHCSDLYKGESYEPMEELQFTQLLNKVRRQSKLSTRFDGAYPRDPDTFDDHTSLLIFQSAIMLRDIDDDEYLKLCRAPMSQWRINTYFLEDRDVPFADPCIQLLGPLWRFWAAYQARAFLVHEYRSFGWNDNFEKVIVPYGKEVSSEVMKHGLKLSEEFRKYHQGGETILNARPIFKKIIRHVSKKMIDVHSRRYPKIEEFYEAHLEFFISFFPSALPQSTFAHRSGQKEEALATPDQMLYLIAKFLVEASRKDAESLMNHK
ncbi:MAG: hypothetical protein DHS80DRAFT_22316 [Piptocephalis tieghemiana]|nr:MAG: hypothetical protein DHS80DRAFT_22316 [Piptocephalis tieghemiana]